VKEEGIPYLKKGWKIDEREAKYRLGVE